MPPHDPNKKHYFKRLSPEELPKFLQECVKQGDEVTIWPKGREDQAETFTSKEHNATSNVLYLGPEKDGIMAKLFRSKLENKTVLLKIDQKTHNLIGEAVLERDASKGAYYINFNGPLFLAQRRSNYRLMASRVNTIRYTVQDEVHKGLDVSAGGTCFTVSAVRADEFPKDKILKSCTLEFNRDKFNIPESKVAGSWPVKDSLGADTEKIKVGVSFINVSKELEEALFLKINSEARAEEIRRELAKGKKKPPEDGEEAG